MKIFTFFVSILICFFFLFNCTEEKKELSVEEIKYIYEKRGYTDMKNRLKPEIIRNPHNTVVMLGVNIENTICTMNDKAEFCLLKFDNNGVSGIDVIVPGFPGIFGNTCYSDNENNVVWMKNGRGLYALDIKTKQSAHSVITNDYTVEIRPDFLADPKENIIFIDIVPPWPEFNHFVLFNIMKNEIIFKSREYGGQFFPFKNKNPLFLTLREKRAIIIIFKFIT